MIVDWIDSINTASAHESHAEMVRGDGKMLSGSVSNSTIGVVLSHLTCLFLVFYVITSSRKKYAIPLVINQTVGALATLVAEAEDMAPEDIHFELLSREVASVSSKPMTSDDATLLDFNVHPGSVIKLVTDGNVDRLLGGNGKENYNPNDSDVQKVQILLSDFDTDDIHDSEYRHALTQHGGVHEYAATDLFWNYLSQNKKIRTSESSLPSEHERSTAVKSSVPYAVPLGSSSAATSRSHKVSLSPQSSTNQTNQKLGKLTSLLPLV